MVRVPLHSFNPHRHARPPDTATAHTTKHNHRTHTHRAVHSAHTLPHTHTHTHAHTHTHTHAHAHAHAHTALTTFVVLSVPPGFV